MSTTMSTAAAKIPVEASAVQVEPAVAGEMQADAPQKGSATGKAEAVDDGDSGNESPQPRRRDAFLAYVKTRDFWMVLILGQILALANIGSSTFTSLMAMEGTNIPAFQTLINYVLLNIVYTSITIYRYGFKKWGQLLWKDGWRYFILAFMDVEGNYFIVLAYRYTTLLSAELFGFWTIVVVVAISFIFLHMRYHLSQYLGIFVCCAGLGLLIASDHLRGADFPGSNKVKGDIFALISATFYGFSNCFEEFLVSKRPMYEVIGQLAFWGMLINGTQAGIFDRSAFHTAVWNDKVGGYLAGYTIMLFIFYSTAPIMFRLSSATFFNISLLTMNFWGLIIGLRVFGLHVHFLYPIAFVLIVLGLFVYFISVPVLGDAKKPWLGEDQEDGVSGIGTAKREQETGHAIV